MGGRFRRQPFRYVALDVLDDDDRVIDDDADCQHQSEQGQGVDGITEQQQEDEGTDDGYRNRRQWNERCPPGLQEQDHDQNDQDNRFDQGGLYRADGVPHEGGRVPDGLILHALREIRRQLVELCINRIRDIQGIGSRRKEDTNGCGMLSVLLDPHGVVAGTQFDPGHIRKCHDLALLTDLEDDFLELLFGFQATAHADGNQEIGRFGRRFCAQLTGGCLCILLPDRIRHVGDRESARCQLVRVQPDPHRVVTRAIQPDVADALNSRELILDVQRQVVPEVERVVLGILGVQAHIHQRGRRLLLGGHAILAHLVRQSAQRLTNPILDSDRGGVRVHRRLEGDDDLQRAIRARDRLHVHDPLDPVDSLLQRRGNGFRNFLRVRPGVDGADDNAWGDHFRVFAHWQQRNGHQAKCEDHQGKDNCVYGLFDEYL
ncbi:hypothetical protein D9M68_424890 [compost metagenome]